jgi:hypothetical protein
MTRGRPDRRSSGLVEDAVAFLRRNPASVAAAALAVGFAIARVTRNRPRGEPDLPVMNTGHARLYDPDEKQRHTPHGGSDTRRDFPIRA